EVAHDLIAASDERVAHTLRKISFMPTLTIQNVAVLNPRIGRQFAFRVDQGDLERLAASNELWWIDELEVMPAWPFEIAPWCGNARDGGLHVMWPPEGDPG